MCAVCAVYYPAIDRFISCAYANRMRAAKRSKGAEHVRMFGNRPFAFGQPSVPCLFVFLFLLAVVARAQRLTERWYVRLSLIPKFPVRSACVRLRAFDADRLDELLLVNDATV